MYGVDNVDSFLLYLMARVRSILRVYTAWDLFPVPLYALVFIAKKIIKGKKWVMPQKENDIFNFRELTHVIVLHAVYDKTCGSYPISHKQGLLSPHRLPSFIVCALRQKK